MNTLDIRRIVLFCAMCWVLALVFLPAQAQGQNLLTNPGFEKPFTTLDGTPPRQVAQGWSPWNLGGGQSNSENVQPQYFPASDASNGLGKPRIRSGSDAQQYFSFFATHDAGLFQRVTGITKGAQLRFGVYVYVWSSTFDDANKSEQDGGVVVTVGIDPSGGTSGDSTNIVWSDPAIQYDAYNEYSMTATASESAVTVFVRTTVSVPVHNTNIYVDDASLVVVNAAVSTASATGTATKTLVPPSPTNTLVPTALVATATPAIPTAVSTSGDLGIVPTDTPVLSATLLPTTAVPTNTSVPSATPSSIPTTVPSDTPLPTSVPPTQEVQIPSATAMPTSSTSSGNVFVGKVVHTVRSGDTVGQLATLYGSTTDAVVSANGLNSSAFIRVGQTLVIPVKLAAPATSTPTITPVGPPPTAVPTTTTYVVRVGDTLFRIAARFNTTASTLAQLNGIANPNIIQVGQRLIIPIGSQVSSPSPAPTTLSPTSAPFSQPTTYVVRPGDTLFRIAVRFKVSLRSLMQANGIVDANRVFVGQVLVIP
jgi:LysM repeat protein